MPRGKSTKPAHDFTVVDGRAFAGTRDDSRELRGKTVYVVTDSYKQRVIYGVYTSLRRAKAGAAQHPFGFPWISREKILK